jgi:hypothetical protein
MGGDPSLCRKQAAECVRLANEGTTQQSRDDFIELANVWLKLAAQLESDGALLDMFDSTRGVSAPRAA